ncbi:MAG: hypothetical protein QJT81_08615 [Candidatus Thiothrix putei]|uniref:Glycosyltransferase subfamily 4-like N-terminal domain-containing protein n=1 Tax=Candidatus Thiothrix putei TaxID=3080811 RepID=A0AA95HEY0_9GAMM|nr:MAG: hypothetical protein QJT81_08615 [Candidatus Thiothrix putei]
MNIVIIAPFWEATGHVGNYRIKRYIDWCLENNIYITMITSGKKNTILEKPWGKQIEVFDRFNLYTWRKQKKENNLSFSPHRKENTLRKYIVNNLLIPDPIILWNWSVAFDSAVQEEIKNSDFILTSSPPESLHILGMYLSKKYKKKHIIDMRDGWLDESLKDSLHSKGIRYWIEKKLEALVVKNSAIILTSSSKWLSLLINRYKNIENKSYVITNGYPVIEEELLNKLHSNKQKNPSQNIIMTYAGRIRGSRSTQRAHHFISPIISAGYQLPNYHFTIQIIGRLTKEDLEEIDTIKLQNNNLKNITITLKDEVEREELFHLLSQSNVLLLTSMSISNIPSKLFEYITLKCPIFATSPKESILFSFEKEIPQLFVNEIESPNINKTIEKIKELSSLQDSALVPRTYHPDEIKRKFLYIVEKHANN